MTGCELMEYTLFPLWVVNALLITLAHFDIEKAKKYANRARHKGTPKVAI